MASPFQRRIVDAIVGLLAGIVATGPMTVAMILWHRRLPVQERYPLPPRQIVMKLARVTGLDKSMSNEARSAATLLAHFGYGGAIGAIYGAVAEELPSPGIPKGILFGLVVWVTNYLAMLPAAGVLHGAQKHPARRNALMIAAHIVWGAATGWLDSVLREDAHGGGRQPFSTAHLMHPDAR